MITAEEAASAPGLPGRTEPVWPWKGAPVHALVQRIHQLQAERAQAFRRLEEAHRQYVRSGPHYDFPRYRGSVHKVTQAFAAASREVLALEAELAGPRAQPLLAGHVRALQQLEQTRLATVSSGRPDPCLAALSSTVLPHAPSLKKLTLISVLVSSKSQGTPTLFQAPIPSLSALPLCSDPAHRPLATPLPSNPNPSIGSGPYPAPRITKLAP
nr:uncharacterized protein C19orf60 homolog [Loxodonta africana]